MATKTFKIGLSNTDKQNMAQDVYERLLALTFPEYDSAESYSVGDFVVYNDQLYKCIGSTSGAWDSTKWQLATLNDLVTDIEDAVAFVNDKANVDGNYPTLTAGLADNLTPYSEDSGAEQENPFISNGTGTNNNTEIVTAGDYALFKEKQGHALSVNQLVQNGNFADNTGWGTYQGSRTIANNKCTFLASAAYGYVKQDITDIINGHSYIICATITLTTQTNKVLLGLMGGYNIIANSYKRTSGNLLKETLFISFNSTSNYSSAKVIVQDERPSNWDNIVIENVFIVDITPWEQSVIDDLTANPDHFSWYYNGSLSYNTGSLGNANGVRLVSTKRNLFDEETELGSINSETGALIPTSSVIRSKNFNVCVPNKDYYIKNTSNVWVYWYDKDYNYLGYTSGGVINDVRKSPENASYFKLVINSTTYNNDITISIYYTPEEGGEGYDQYYPYEEPYVVDTGNEVLRQAGSKKDYKTPDGTIHRLVGSVDLGTLTWTSEGSGRFYAPIPNALGNSGIYGITFIIPKYTPTNSQDALQNGFCRFGVSSINFNICDTNYSDATAFKNSLNGVILNYELAEPTTEQGTPFAENLPINDYGMLYWLDSSNNLVGIPQGCKIFYPVNYKGFVDDVYARTDGDASKLVIQSERTADKTELQGVDTQLKNAIGGTLRQLLASANNVDFANTKWVDLGTLTFTVLDVDYPNLFIASISDIVSSTINALCSLYKLNNVAYVSMNNMEMRINGSNVILKNTSYTDATAFKNAMKGVLLAYEKASE